MEQTTCHNATIADECTIAHCWLENVIVGEGSTLLHCQIRGLPDRPVVIGEGVQLIGCQVDDVAEQKSFRFGSFSIQSQTTTIGDAVRLHHARLVNSQIGERTQGFQCSIRHSLIAERNNIRPMSSVLLSQTSPGCNLGSEISKCIFEGSGFVSEHTSSYLSLVAPAHYPIVNEAGEEVLLESLPNLTNIGAGTVFANYSGKPKPAKTLKESSGSLKGTAVAWGTFTAVNSVIVNRYGSPSESDSVFEYLRNPELTTLGFASFVERKVTGRIPAFAYSGSTSASEMQLGWVLEKHPGIVLNLLKKMQKQLGAEAGRLQGLIEGTIRLELRLMKEALDNPDSPWTTKQLEEGIELLESHLDGRWRLDEEGQLVSNWSCEAGGRWQSSLL